MLKRACFLTHWYILPSTIISLNSKERKYSYIKSHRNGDAKRMCNIVMHSCWKVILQKGMSLLTVVKAQNGPLHLGLKHGTKHFLIQISTQCIQFW